MDEELDEHFESHCHNCGKTLRGWTFSDIINAEIRFRDIFVTSWHEVPRILLCDDCFNEKKREHGL